MVTGVVNQGKGSLQCYDCVDVCARNHTTVLLSRVNCFGLVETWRAVLSCKTLSGHGEHSTNVPPRPYNCFRPFRWFMPIGGVSRSVVLIFWIGSLRSRWATATLRCQYQDCSSVVPCTGVYVPKCMGGAPPVTPGVVEVLGRMGRIHRSLFHGRWSTCGGLVLACAGRYDWASATCL